MANGWDHYIWCGVRFVVVGGVAALGYFAVAELFFSVTHSVPLSSALGYLAMLPFSYLGHKRWTFRSENPYKDEIGRFATVSLAALSFAIAAPIAFVQQWRLPLAGALVLTCVVVPLVNFVAMQIWVFGARSVRMRIEDLSK